MNYEIIIDMTLIMLFSHWFNFLMGNPMSAMFDQNAILFFIPYSFAIKKMKKLDLYNVSFLDDQLELTKTDREKIDVMSQFKRDVYQTAQQYFSIEKVILCKLCFHFWLTALFLILCPQQGISFIIFLYLVNYLILKKI